MVRGRPVKIKFNPKEKVREHKPFKNITVRERFVEKYDATYDSMKRVLRERERRIVKEMNTRGLSAEKRERLTQRYNNAREQNRLLDKKYNSRKRVLETQGKMPKTHPKFKVFLSDPFFREMVLIHGRKNRRSSMAFLDLDYLHYVNALVTHAGGNVVLQAVGEALKETIGRKGGYFGKHGGEEILVWAPIPKEEMSRLLKQAAVRLQKKVSAGMAQENIHPVNQAEINRLRQAKEITSEDKTRMTALLKEFPSIGKFSAGIVDITSAELRRDFNGTYSKAIESSDKLHYNAKNKGRNRIAYTTGKQMRIEKLT